MERLLILLVFSGISFSSFGQARIDAVKIGNRIDISVDNKLFTQYHFADSEKYPFFFPVNGPSGLSVKSMRNSL